MKTKFSLQKGNLRVAILAISALILIVACSKDGPAVTPENLFTTQLPHATTISDRWKTDSTGIEVGLKFRSTVAINITALKFYKSTKNDGYHILQLYTGDGLLLASDSVTNETDSGWQSVILPTPIPMAANTTFIVSYFSSNGLYVSTNNVLKGSMSNGTLVILADGQDGPNGIYAYCNNPAFPNQGFQATNYWVDISEEKQGQ
jgi:hypothetical protein